MKNIILVIAVVAFMSVTACAQNAKNLPVKVKTSFNQKFPGAQKIKWGKENATEWEAEFTLNNREYSANFNSDGNWVETEYLISEKEIPAAVSATLSHKYPGYKIKTAEITETAKGNVFAFEMLKGKTKTDATVNADGTLVVKDKEKVKD